MHRIHISQPVTVQLLPDGSVRVGDRMTVSHGFQLFSQNTLVFQAIRMDGPVTVAPLRNLNPSDVTYAEWDFSFSNGGQEVVYTPSSLGGIYVIKPDGTAHSDYGGFKTYFGKNVMRNFF